MKQVNKPHPDDNQCTKLLRYLRKLKSLDTLQIRSAAIMHPAGCIFRLRREGHNILTERKKALDEYGRPHIAACYTLLPGRYKGERKVRC